MALTRIALATLATGLLSSGAVLAEEQTLRFKLVTTMISDAKMDLPSISDQSVVANEAVGVAYFEDGRIAFKRFAIANVGGEEEGNYMGRVSEVVEIGRWRNLRVN
jgi:hypothetical protein